MVRKAIASGPVHGPLVEKVVDCGPGRAEPRRLTADHRVPGTKVPPPEEGWLAKAQAEGRR